MTDMPENTLKPCPFCGGEAELQVEELDINSLLGCVVCMECYATGAEKDNWSDAITSWNTRADIAWNEALEAALRLCEMVLQTDACASGSEYDAGYSAAAQRCFDEIEAMKREPK